jgi:hypothetical protein
MGKTFSERFAVKLARYHAAKKKATARRIYRRRKQRVNAELRAVLAMAQALLGWKPNRGMTGVKLSEKHIKALHAGRDKYHQTKRNGLKKNMGRSLT